MAGWFSTYSPAASECHSKQPRVEQLEELIQITIGFSQDLFREDLVVNHRTILVGKAL